MSRLADILREEYKTKGVFSGTTSAMGKRSLEKLDIRNALFGGSGVGSAIGQKIFGKGYRAIKKRDVGGSSPTEIGGDSGGILQEISISSKITAKNTLALPAMARDMSLVKTNIAKLVKLQGGTPQTKAGDWFGRQQAREAAFESQYSKKTSPMRSDNKKESGGGLLDWLFSGGSLLEKVIGGLIKGGLLVGALAALGEGIKKLFSDAEFRQKVFDGISNFFKSEFGKSVGIGLIAVASAFAAFKVAVNLITAAIEAAALRIGRSVGLPTPGGGGGGGKGGAKGKTPAKGGGGWGSIAAILGLQAAGSIMDSGGGGGDGTGGGGDGTAGGGGGGQTNFAKVGVNTAVAGIAGVDAISRVKDVMSRGPDVKGYNAKAGRFVDSTGKFTKTSNLPKGDMLKKFFDFAAKAASKGWMSRIGGKLAVRLGTSVATKVVVFLGGLAVPGAGWLASAASMALLAYDIYAIYDAIFGAGGILEELEKEDASKGSAAPSTTPTPAGSTAPAPTLSTAEEGSTGGGATSPSPAGGTLNGQTIGNLAQGGKNGKKVGVVMHHTGGSTMSGALAALKQKGFSYNYMIDRDGTVHRLIPEGATAIHGGQMNNGLTNENTLGVALVAKDNSDVLPEQVAAAKTLQKQLAQKFNFDEKSVYGHGEVSPGRKQASEGMAAVMAIRQDTGTPGASPTAPTQVASAGGGLAGMSAEDAAMGAAVSGEGSGSGAKIDNGSKQVATAQQTNAQKQPEININVADLAKAFASPTGPGQFAKAMPHNPDFYAGIIKTEAL